MVYISPIGRNWGPIVNWDSLGKLYASIAIIWTVILALGSAWLIRNRNLPFLRIRNIPLAIVSVCFLHVYLVKILLAYTVNGHFLCSAEFWIMSIYLPFGIALFQANMVQLLSISTQQRKLLDGDRSTTRDRIRNVPGIRGLWIRWRSLSALEKTYVGIGVGMFLQVVITAAIYGTNRKLQGHWGKIARPQGQALCRKGPEWIPSALWQLFWCCIYGPYLLYKIRNVHDTHHWRTQTILCIVSGFPGAPLWLAAVFTPSAAWKWVNRYYVPPMWLAPGIFVMQACTIFFPIYEAYHQQRLNKATSSILRTWEDNKNWDDTTLGSGSRSSVTNWQSLHSTHQRLGSNADTSTFKDQERERDQQARMSMSQYRSNEMYTIAALEKALAINHTPLLHFAATKDFTAENILFLVAVRDWKAKWSRLRASPLPNPTPQVTKMLWREAMEIYACGVSEKYAEFPINIEGKLRTELDNMFSAGVEVLRLEMEGWREKEEQEHDIFSPISPFSNSPPGEVHFKSPPPIITREINGSNSSFIPSSPRSPTTQHEEIEMFSKERYDESIVTATQIHDEDEKFSVPEGFDERVFDAAEKSIMYLVVTNTWRKFVTAMREGDPRVSGEMLA